MFKSLLFVWCFICLQRSSSSLALISCILALMLIDCCTEAAPVDMSAVFFTVPSNVTCRQLTSGALTRRLRHNRLQATLTLRDETGFNHITDSDRVSRSRNNTETTDSAAKLQRQHSRKASEKTHHKRHRQQHDTTVATVDRLRISVNETGHGHEDGETSPPWHCQWEPRWARLGQGHFPSYVLSGRCESQRTCMFGLYECRPKKYVTTVLRRVPGKCVPLPTSDTLETVYEELWVPTKHRVTVGCECARRSPSHIHVIFNIE